MRLLLLSLILVSSFASAQGGASPVAKWETKSKEWGSTKWTTGDTVRQSLYGVVRFVDMAQSRTMAKHPEQWRESGVIAVALYGPHPSVAEVHKFNLLMFLGVWLVAYNLDPPKRMAWQWTHIGVETWVVNENRKLGVEADWPIFNFGFVM